MTTVRPGVTGPVTINSKVYRCIERTVEEVEPLADQIRTGLTASDRSDKYGATSRWDTWHKGFGLGEIREVDEKGRYHYSQNVDARFRSQLILGPELATSAFNGSAESKHTFIEYNGSFYAIGTRYVHVWNSGTNQWDVSKDMGASSAAIRGCAAVYGDYLVVGAGASVDYWRLYTDGVWDQPAVIKAQLFALVGNTLWRVFSSNQLSSSTNFTTWASAVAIGESRHVATLLTDYNGNPLVGKPEGLFEYDGSSVSNRLPELGYRLSSTNCAGGKPSRGKLYLPIGPSLWSYTADAVQTEGKPTRSAEYLAPGITRLSATEVRGSIKDIWPDVDFLWTVLAAASGNYYIAAYDYNPLPGQGWHQVSKTGATSVSAIGRFQPSSGNPRIFYSEGTEIKYFLLPQDAQNPYVDTNYRYTTSGDIYLSLEADLFEDETKAYLSLRIVGNNLATGSQYIDVYYSVDGGGETSLGRVQTSGMSELLFPSTTTGNRIQIRFHLVTDDATKTPQVLPSSRLFQYRFDPKRKWNLTLALGRKALPNLSRQGFSQLSLLETARTTDSPITFVDVDRRSWTAFVTKVGQTEVRDDGSEQTWVVPVELVEWRETAAATAVQSPSITGLNLWGVMPGTLVSTIGQS